MNTENKFKNLINVGAVLLGILAVYVLFLAIGQAKSLKFIGKNLDMPNYITVTGEGEAVSVPDIATFSFTVSNVSKTVNTARDASTAVANKALDVLKKEGLSEKDIKTSSYSISPEYEYTNDCNTFRCTSGKQTLIGYRVSQTIEVTIRDLEKVGSIFTQVSATGVDIVNNLNFSIESEEELKSEARKQAINKARTQAEDIADGLGVKLVRITSFNEGGYYPYYAKSAMAESAVGMGMDMAPAPSIPTGEQKITSNVTITYEIR